MIYLAKWVCCQLAGEDVPWIPMGPPMFMLTPRCMTNMEYKECGLGIPFTNRVINESDYEEFFSCLPSPFLYMFVLLLFSFNQ